MPVKCSGGLENVYPQSSPPSGERRRSDLLEVEEIFVVEVEEIGCSRPEMLSLV